jgi:hypothetical protein
LTEAGYSLSAASIRRLEPLTVDDPFLFAKDFKT